MQACHEQVREAQRATPAVRVAIHKDYRDPQASASLLMLSRAVSSRMHEVYLWQEASPTVVGATDRPL